jgi:hypothetical protein
MHNTFKRLNLLLFLMCASTTIAALENPTYIHNWHNNKHGIGIKNYNMPSCGTSICVDATYLSPDNGGLKQGLNLHTSLPDAGGNVVYINQGQTVDRDEKDPILQDDFTRYVGKLNTSTEINYLGTNNSFLGSGNATYIGQDTPIGTESLKVTGAPTGVYTFQGQLQYKADKSIPQNNNLNENDPNYNHQPTNSNVTAVVNYGTNGNGFFKEVQEHGYIPHSFNLSSEGDTSAPFQLTYEANSGGAHNNNIDVGLNPGVIHSAGYGEEFDNPEWSIGNYLFTDSFERKGYGGQIRENATSASRQNNIFFEEQWKGGIKSSKKSIALGLDSTRNYFASSLSNVEAFADSTSDIANSTWTSFDNYTGLSNGVSTASNYVANSFVGDSANYVTNKVQNTYNTSVDAFGNIYDSFSTKIASTADDIANTSFGRKSNELYTYAQTKTNEGLNFAKNTSAGQFVTGKVTDASTYAKSIANDPVWQGVASDSLYLGEKATDAAAIGATVITGGASLSTFGLKKGTTEIIKNQINDFIGFDKDALLNNIADSKKARESSNFGIHVQKEADVLNNIPVNSTSTFDKDALLNNIADSKKARESSNFDQYLVAERKVVISAQAEQERLAAKKLSDLESSIPDAHFSSKHGAQTTLEQQKDRAINGIDPITGLPQYDRNGQLITHDSTKFISNQDQLYAIEKAIEINNARVDKKDTPIEIKFNYIIGEGYKKDTGVYGLSKTALIYFRNGDVRTAFPIYGK